MNVEGYVEASVGGRPRCSTGSSRVRLEPGADAPRGVARSLGHRV